MAENWQVGDLALCIGCADGVAWDFGFGPASGAVCKVAKIKTNPADGELHLGLIEWPSRYLYHSIEFRKIHPLTDEEREDFEEDLRVPGHDSIPHAPQAPAREGVTLPVRSFEPHTPLRDRAGPSDHNRPHASEVSHV